MIANVLLALSVVFSLVLPVGQSTPAAGNGSPEEAVGYLEFYSELDGRCQIRSDGGKLRVLKNNHRSKAIKFRIARYFSGKRQPSLLVGVIDSGGEIKPLGCTLIDHHEQTWQLESADYVEVK